MRVVVALLGLFWAAGNLFAAILLIAGGVAAKTAAKGLIEQALLLLGGLLIAGLAVLLAWQCVGLARSGNEQSLE